MYVDSRLGSAVSFVDYANSWIGCIGHKTHKKTPFHDLVEFLVSCLVDQLRMLTLSKATD